MHDVPPARAEAELDRGGVQHHRVAGLAAADEGRQRIGACAGAVGHAHLQALDALTTPSPPLLWGGSSHPSINTFIALEIDYC